ncbi:MAG: hypothetical protein IPH12_06840 [Saprospirales bacterium]|nr:hypothetical protein [Saprospirales bacterium]
MDNAAKTANGGQLLLSGAQVFVNPVILPANARRIDGFPEMLRFLDELAQRQTETDSL